MIDWLAQRVTGHAALVVALAVALTLLSMTRLIDPAAIAEQRWAEAVRLRIDPSMSSVLPTDDPDRDFYERVRKVFGNDETLLLAVRHPDGVFQTDVLAALKRTTEALERVAGVRAVISLANAPSIRSVDGDLVVEPLYTAAPEGRAELAQLRALLFDDPLLPGVLESELGDAALGSSLLALGIEQRTLRALGLIPMLQVAWADGELADGERSAILDAAHALGIDLGSESYSLLSDWLEAPPDPELFRAWQEYVATLVGRLSVEGRLRLRDHMLTRARAVARAHGGVVGLRAVSQREEQVIQRIEATFESHPD